MHKARALEREQHSLQDFQLADTQDLGGSVLVLLDRTRCVFVA